MSKYAVVRLLGLSMAVMSLGACGDSLGVSQTATIRVLLTDAPADYIGEAFVDIGAVELLPSDGGDRIVLSEDGTDGPVNLLDLQGLATEVLADLEIPVGTYHQLRLFVESASVTLADGYLFSDGSGASVLSVPSGAQTGIKLKLRSGDPEDGDAEGVEIRAGETILVVDFDVSQSFRIQGNPSTPAGIKSVSFRPTLRVVVQDLSGSISGVVSTALPNTSVEGLVVTAEMVDPGDDEEFQTQTATAMTDANGAYSIFFVAPGTYSVAVDPPDGLIVEPASQEAVVAPSGDVADVNFAVIVTP